MKAVNICDAMAFLDDDIIVAAEAIRNNPQKQSGKRKWKNIVTLAACFCIVLACTLELAKHFSTEENNYISDNNPMVDEIYNYSELGYGQLNLTNMNAADYSLNFQALEQSEIATLTAYFCDGFDGPYIPSDFRYAKESGYRRIQDLGLRIANDFGQDEASYAQSVRDFELVGDNKASLDFSDFSAFPASSSIQNAFKQIVLYTEDSVLGDTRVVLEGCYIESAKHGNNPIFGFSYDAFDTCYINVIGGDLSSLGAQTNDMLDIMREIYNGDNCSEIDGVKLALACFSQQRIIVTDDAVSSGATERCNHYFTYMIVDGIEYLLQFSSNYTVEGTDKAYYNIPSKSQQECLNAYVDYLYGLADVIR